MENWQIVLLHTRGNTLLKRACEAAFPGRVASLHVPALNAKRRRGIECTPEEMLSYFRRQVYDSGLWSGRVLTIYGDGDLHHCTYALTRLAAERRGMESPELNWTYFHFDNHRDDWGIRNPNGTVPYLNCGSFVDAIAHNHGAVPFMVGPDAYPFKDSRGYQISGRTIPIYSNYFSKELQRSRDWKGVRLLKGLSDRINFPRRADLYTTPTPAYMSFDLDVLARSEIVTNFDQNEHMTVKRLCQILDRIRPYKRVFSADILGFPDTCQHALSALTIIILAKKIMGLGTKSLLGYHGRLKPKQAALVTNGAVDFEQKGRTSPIEAEELLEVLRYG